MARPRKNASSSSSSGSTGSENRLSSGQAAYVVERLLRERRISQGEINRYVSEMGREISALEERLQRLREAHGGQIVAAAAGIGAAAGVAAIVRRGRRPGRPPGRPGRPPGRPAAATASTTGTDAGTTGGGTTGTGTGTGGGGAKRGRKRSAITSEQLASRQLQGRYLALVRQFAESKRAQYAKIAKERGREAAIREMQDALRK